MIMYLLRKVLMLFNVTPLAEGREGRAGTGEGIPC